MEILSFFLLCQIFAKAKVLSGSTMYCDSSGTKTTCESAINGTVCLVCPTPKEDRTASWYRDNKRIFRYENNALSDESQTFYSIKCHEDMYSLEVSCIGLEQAALVYWCKTSNSTHGFTIMPHETPTVIIEERDAQGNDVQIFDCIISGLISTVHVYWLINQVKVRSHNLSGNALYRHTSNLSVPMSQPVKEVSCKVTGPYITTTNATFFTKGNGESISGQGKAGGIIALYIIVPCLFIASMVTSFLLFYKAKHYRQRNLEVKRKSDYVLDKPIFDGENYDGTVRVYSDIKDDEDEPVAELATSSSSITTLISRLKTSGTFEYWNATYVNESSEEQKCFAKTLSSLATMKDATAFQELALNLKSLPDNSFIVKILCVSVEELPYSIYYEYVECGSLRDFMLRRYQQARKSIMSLSIGNPEILPANVKNQIEELLTFATMIAEALQFITSQKFCHPCLSLKKILLSEYCECKLYDIYPAEMAMTRIKDLMKKDDPPIAWMAVETIFLQEYQTSSDVWSFAVLLWELFSLGEVPFARNTREEVEHKIRNGTVLTQPLCCPGAIYGIMLSCWNNTTAKRPTFEGLLPKLRNMMAKFKEQDRRLPTVSEVPEMPYFVLDPNEAHNNYI